MSVKFYILIALSLSLQFLIKAEVPRVKYVNNENSLSQRISDLEREVNSLKIDNRYLSFKLNRTEQRAIKLEQEIESLSRIKNETIIDKPLIESSLLNEANDALKNSLLNRLLRNLGTNPVQNQTFQAKDKVTTNGPNKVRRDYDEHFNCIEDCGQTNNFPTTCAEALAVNRTGDGIYQLYAPNKGLKPFYAYCLQDAYGDNAWLVVQRRERGNINFARNWTDYVQGFGDLNGDYWLGLERIHALTTTGKYELWIQMKDNSEMGRYASYNEFAIGDGTENFKLTKLGEYVGDAGNSLSFNFEAQFSTYDRDNDDDEESNCAEKRMSGWWFKDCKQSLNGIYNSSDYGTGINWIGWHDYRYSLKYVHIAIRPVTVDVMPKTAMVVKPVSVEQ